MRRAARFGLCVAGLTLMTANAFAVPARSGDAFGAAVPAVTFDPITSASVVPTRIGGFALLMGTQNGAAHVQLFEAGQARGALQQLKATGVQKVFAAQASGSADAYVALLAAGSVRTFRLDTSTSPPSPRDEKTSTTSAYSVSIGRSVAGAAPLMSLMTTTEAVVGPFGEEGTAVPTPGALGASPAVFGASSKGALIAYSLTRGARAIPLGADGTRNASPILELPDTEPTLSASITDLGDDQIVAYWPTSIPTSHVLAERIGADGTSLEKRSLAKTTIALVPDRDAPSGPDAMLLTNEGDRLFESRWSSGTQDPDAGPNPTIAPRLLTVSPQTQVAGACSREGCLYVLVGGRPNSYRAVWAPRTGAVVESDLPVPQGPGGGGGGGGRPVPPGTVGTDAGANSGSAGGSEISTGCSTGATPVGSGFCGVMAAVAAIGIASRRRRR